ncbi:tetratricopeptide repeat protein [Alkalinema sp. FACHB-956]|uniref:tetratricopeptide repeat protein n=1 Tax=Alkalinema sp. FACHB-956 TaxID=2692768 RepID=UPI001685842B|nr:tetratricopeptide repeat protein [Alkalinema sp. FACHB-956]MBD2327322.1 tetratricopeptide repeat protein [Alkalinema sp. FACHB-956]
MPVASGELFGGRLFGAEQIREVPLWVGRDALLVELRDELLVRRRKVLVLVGQGGIGKTSLAVKLLEACGVEARHQRLRGDCPFERVIYVRVQEGMSFDGVVAELLRGLDRSLSEGLRTEQMVGEVIGGLQRSRCLVVLDNLEDVLTAGKAVSAGWGELLWALVDRVHQSQVIVTSRELPIDLADQSGQFNPAMVRSQQVGGIAISDGMQLLRQQGLQDSAEDLQWVAERVGGHVQILTFLGNLATTEPPGYLRGNPELVVQQGSVIVNRQLSRQTREARALLRKMCVLRMGIDVRGLTFLRLYNRGLRQDIRFLGLKWWKRSIQFTPQEIAKTQNILDSLNQCCLVEVRSEIDSDKKFYTLHNVVSETVRCSDENKLPELLSNVYSFYRTGGTVKSPKTLKDLSTLLEAQHFAFQLGNYQEAWSLLSWELEKYLSLWGHWSLLQSLLEEILPYLKSKNKARCLGLLGIIERNRGNWDAAERLFRQYQQMCEELGDRSGMATSWGVLGDIECKRGNWDAAERLYRQCLQIEEELGDRSGMATSWASLGYIENVRGNWDAAERLYRQYQQMCEELGDRSGMATSWGLLGDIERNRGNWDAAERLFRQSLQLREELGDRSGMASSWGVLGDIERNRGNWDAAERLYRQYQQMCEELGDRSGMATSWGQLGDIERNRGNWDAAERLFRQSLQLREELGDRSGMAVSIGCLGENELGRGNLDQAEVLLKDALAQMQQLGMTDSIAETHWDLAQLYHAKNNPKLAHQHYTTAHQLYSQLGAIKDLEKIEAEGKRMGF